MRRGDVVTVAGSGDNGKPRPAVIVQSDAFPATHASVVICQLTSDLTDAPDFRITIEPSEANGLRLPARIMADKPVTVRRAGGLKVERCGEDHLPRISCPFPTSVSLCGFASRCRVP
jgi:mRNA interferase MazF